MPKPGKKYEDMEGRIQDYCAESGIVTSWIIVAEVKNADDTWGLQVVHDVNSPSWRYHSMLSVAHDLLEEGLVDALDSQDETDD